MSRTTPDLPDLLRTLASAPTGALLGDRDLAVELLERAGWRRGDDDEAGERWHGPQGIGATAYLQQDAEGSGLSIGVLAHPADRAGTERLRLELEEALLARPDGAVRLVETDDVWHSWSDDVCAFDIAAEEARAWGGKHIPPTFQLGIGPAGR